jgi:hypothetical protein
MTDPSNIKARTDALYTAAMLAHSLPGAAQLDDGCPHRDPHLCDCPEAPAEQRTAWARAREEAEVDRVLRIADVLYTWAATGEDLRKLEAGAALDDLARGG